MTATTVEQGHHYRRWEDRGRRPNRAWPAIAVNGVRLALAQPKTRTLLLTCAVPVLGACGIFYAISLLETLIGMRDADELFDFIRSVLHVDVRGFQSVEQLRDALWRATFLFMIKVQMIWVLIVGARVGAGLISKDLRARALPIYFSKPVTSATYLVGKWAVIAVFLAMVMPVPNLLALGLGTIITGGPGSWTQILSIACGLTGSGLLVCVVGGAAILALSSLTSDQRYVTVGWVALCVLSMFAQRVIDESIPAASSPGWLQAISLRDNVIHVSERLLGVRRALEASSLPAERFRDALVGPMAPPHVIVLVVLVVASVVIAWRRVVGFSRSAATIQ